MKQWFAVQTHVRGEKLAQINLLRQGFEVYLPLYLKRRRHARRIDWVKAPLFPRYLFTRLDLQTMAWGAINSTIGIHSIVCFNGYPAAVPEHILEELMAREDAEGMIHSGAVAPFRPGEEIRIMEGALADQKGLFDCPHDEERVFILLNLLGRQVRVKVALNSVAANA